MSCKHFDCICYSPTTDSCDYILIFGRRRGIPGDKCDLCLKGFDDEHRPIIKGYTPRYVNHGLLRKLEKAYSPDKTINDMAKKASVNADFVSRWVRKVHPEFNNWGGQYVQT